MIPFNSSLELSKFVNGRYVRGPFSYRMHFDYLESERETVILLDVDFDGVQHFCSVYAPNFDFVYANFVAAGQIEDRINAVYQD